MDAYSSFINYRQKLKTTLLSHSGQMDKQTGPFIQWNAMQQLKGKN